MSRFLLQAAKVAVEAVTDTAAVSSKAVNPLLKEALAMGRPGGEFAAKETAAASPLATEAAAALSQPATEGVRRGLLTLGKDFIPIGLKSADGAEIPRQGLLGKVVRGEERTFATANRNPRAAGPVEAMTDQQAGNFITNAVRNQGTILAENAKISESGTEQVGRFAQMEIYKPLKLRFDQVNKNPNLQLTATADASAADMVGADFVLFNKANKDFWILDAKPLNALNKEVPTARGNGLVLYPDIFKHNGKGFYFNPRDRDFLELIEKSAANLTDIGNKTSFFNLRQHALPSMSPGSLQSKWSEINGFQKALLQDKNPHVAHYGKDLNRSLTWLEQTAKERGIMLRSAR